MPTHGANMKTNFGIITTFGMLPRVRNVKGSVFRVSTQLPLSSLRRCRGTILLRFGAHDHENELAGVLKTQQEVDLRIGLHSRPREGCLAHPRQ